MDKASKAFRRSSVRLKSLNSGHSDLNMIVSDLGEVRATSKAFLSAQITAWQDMVKWASREQNSALQEVFQHLFELNALWSEVQREFIADLKKFKHNFEVILEGEQHIDKSRSHLLSCEQREVKLRKDLRKATTKGTYQEMKQCEEKLVEARALIKAAQAEVNGKVCEQEAVKIIIVKEGLVNLTESYLELAEKAVMIFQSQRDVAKDLPEVQDKEIQDVKYTGSEAAKRSIIKAKESVHCYKRPSYRIGAPSDHTSPPPYTNSPAQSNFAPSFVYPSPQPVPQPFGSSVDHRYSEVPDEPGPWDSRCSVGFQNAYYPPRYDLPPRENYENVAGAVGGLHITDSPSGS